jgi:hypothetical protein
MKIDFYFISKSESKNQFSCKLREYSWSQNELKVILKAIKFHFVRVSN